MVSVCSRLAPFMTGAPVPLSLAEDARYNSRETCSSFVLPRIWDFAARIIPGRQGRDGKPLAIAGSLPLLDKRAWLLLNRRCDRLRSWSPVSVFPKC